MANQYTLTISRLTVDKLGVRLYDRVSAVIAELVANSYDADATEVEIRAPMDHFLATKSDGVITDRGLEIEVIDNGIGMTPEEVNRFYLVVGKERRNDPDRGNITRKYKRKVMGRKGVGKIAPFGVCQKIEVLTAGGKKISVKKGSKTVVGYRTAHLILDKTAIVNDTDKDYHPEIGAEDGTLRPKTGTTLRLTLFDHRKVPSLDEFERQLAQRFGLSSPSWKITLTDTHKKPSDPNFQKVVGEFSVATMEGTKITFEQGSHGKPGNVVGPQGLIAELKPGFMYEGKFHSVWGWVAYSKQPYKDDLMAGIRVYCRGKIAAQTNIFNLKAGFTGEYDVRSYLVGSLNADWLDESEDLIRTDRQDILWSHDLSHAFEEWGQNVVKKVGLLTREPTRKKSWDIFRTESKIEERLDRAFPGAEHKSIRENSLEIAQVLAKATREDELKQPDHLESLVQLTLLLGPHITLDRKLREAGDSQDSPLAVITGILKTARTAELSAFGRIADDRIKVIKKVETLKDNEGTLEAAFQDLIETAPWLINPQWSPIAANETFTTLRKEFQKFYKAETGKELILGKFHDPAKRADFVMSNQDGAIEIVEIKKPAHALKNDEMDRIIKYIDLMEEFLAKQGHEEFKRSFPVFHVTLVCDGIKLEGAQKRSFEAYIDDKTIEHVTWSGFLRRTRKMHESFLKEEENQNRWTGRTQ